MKISVIMPNFNGAKYLAGAIESFVLQCDENSELIIVDGKSTDGSHAIIGAACAEHNNIRWLEETDDGVSEGFNKGVAVARGDVIGFFASDDLMHDGLLAKIRAAFLLDRCDAVYFDSANYYPLSGERNDHICRDVAITRKNLLRYGPIFGFENIYFARRVFESHLLDTTLRYAMDYEFTLRIASERYVYSYLNFIGTTNQHDGNISSLYEREQYFESCSIARRYGHFYDRLCFLPIKRSRLRSRLGAVKRALASRRS